MKNTLFLALFLCVGILNAQNFKLNFISSIDYSDSEYTYQGGFEQPLDSGEINNFPLGYSCYLQTEFGLSEKISFLTGLTYSQKNFNPQLNLGFAYGWLPDPNDPSIYMENAYLKRHRFRTIGIPIMLKIRFAESGKLKPYFAFGFNTSFRFWEEELFAGRIWNTETFGFDKNELSHTNSEFRLFGTSFDLSLGFQYEIKEGIDLIVNSQLSAWELRMGNEKFKENGNKLFERALLPLSNVSLGVGIQKAF